MVLPFVGSAGLAPRWSGPRTSTTRVHSDPSVFGALPRVGWVAPSRQNGGVPTDPVLDPAVAARLKRDEHGLVAAIVQQQDSGEVLMLGWMDDEALRRTLTEGRVTFWSRSRREYWRKGDTSGHAQHVRSVALDCDGDALLVRVEQVGAACHTGDRTCFDAGDLGAVVGAGA
ncbi:phosphoribosyl-AMP cyclohydrolase [Arthrobacter sp. NEB 688]|nr:phosphoribosyl-AMP cyclohydrolase [Arthrobacter sp. NEB 688]